MLDLTKEKEEYLPIKFRTGLRLELKKPTLRMAAKLQSVSDSDDVNDLLDVLTLIINNNKQGKSLTVEEVDKLLTIDDIILLARALAEFCQQPKN